MPVTQRWVHGGLVFVAVIFSVSLTVLILGASRPTVNNAGLTGSPAPLFSLRDSNGDWLNMKDCRTQTVVLLFVPAESSDFNKPARQISDVIDSFGSESDVRFVGVEFDPHSGLLDPGKLGSGALETNLPRVQALRDVDGSVAQAYRVARSATMFVIDPTGIIRSRVSLEGDGASVVAGEVISSLRHPTVTLPLLSNDRKEF